MSNFINLTPSIRDMVRKRILDEMLGTLTRNKDSKDDPWKVLIVDEETVHIMNAAVRVRDINKKNVTVVEHLEKARQPFPNLIGVYFMAPTQKSVNKFLEDFNDKKQQYGCACLFFTSRLSKKLVDLIGDSKAVKFVKTLIELNLDFLALERTVFSLNTPEDMELMYSPRTNDETKGKVAEILADKMLSVLITLGQHPYIRYNAKSATTERVANAISDKLDGYRSRSVKNNLPSLKQDSVLLVLDRSADAVAPLLHEFTYQAMAFDMLNIPLAGIYEQSYQDQKNQAQKRKVILDEYDPIWVNYKYLHIDVAKRTLDKEIAGFVDQNKSLLGPKDKNNSKDIASMMSKLPQFREQSTKYGIHRTTIAELLSRFQKDQVPKIAMLEQNMAVGQTPEGEKLSNVLSSITAILRDETIAPEVKCRLLLIYMLTQGNISEENQNKLIKTGKLEGKYERMINNLPCLGAQGKNNSILGKISSFFGIGGKAAKEVDYDLSRYTTKVKELSEEILKGKLSEKEYPYVKDPPKDFKFDTKEPAKDAGKKEAAKAAPEEVQSLRTKRTGPAWERPKANKQAAPEENLVAAPAPAVQTGKKKLIVLMVGGMVHSETRASVELERDYQVEVYTGGTSIMTPKLFLDKLASLK